MNLKMRKILIVITTGFVPYGGLTTVMMNYYRAMDKTGLKIDFASTNEAPEGLIAELHKRHSQYFNLGNRKKHLIKYIRRLNKLLKRERYDVIHVNGNSATMAFELQIAKKRRVPIRIAHGHTTRSDYLWLHKALFYIFRKSYTHCIAVSHKTGEWLFPGRKYIILNNAIHVEKYKYNALTREKYRDMLRLSDKFVVGNVGKLYYAKNQSFLIQTFYELQKQKKNTYLLLVGDGVMKKELEKQCKILGIEANVIFLGIREDIPELLQAMDIFVFPSIYEGFPLAMLEAQAAGLPLLVSDAITGNAKCTDKTFYKPLSDGAKDWAKRIIEIADMIYDREEDISVKFREHGLDIETCAKKLREIYLN